MSDHALFTLRGLRRGAQAAVPITPGVAIFGVAFGLLAGERGLSLGETALMSATVFAGASQMAALQLWGDPVPVAALAATAGIVNLRYMMMTAALGPWLRGIGAWRAAAGLFLTVDENWALTIADGRVGRPDGGFLVGSGFLLWLSWQVATGLGRGFGAILPAPDRLGLDFVGTGAFTALAAVIWRGRRDTLPWLVAAAVAIVVHRLLAGPWYLLAGGLAGSVVGTIAEQRRGRGIEARPS